MTKARRQNNRRKVNGIFLLDKPKGVTSNAALQSVKAMFYARKAGHTGSLDPLATGMLPICFGEATKFSQYLLDADKVYEVTIKLGERTETGDSEGSVVETAPVPSLSLSDIERAFEAFRGVISQIPPMYSALKYQGQPLYKLARQGITVPREPREITVYALTIAAYEAPYLTFSVRCTKGTYVRVLGEDIAKALGTVAHVTALHRSSVGGFSAAQMVSHAQLETLCQEKQFAAMDALLLPVEAAINALPSVSLTAAMAFYLSQGNPVMVPNVPDDAPLLRLLTKEGGLLGVGEVLDNGLVAPKRLLSKPVVNTQHATQ